MDKPVLCTQVQTVEISAQSGKAMLKIAEDLLEEMAYNNPNVASAGIEIERVSSRQMRYTATIHFLCCSPYEIAKLREGHWTVKELEVPNAGA